MSIPRKILAVKFRSLGDTILMTPALTELRLAYPLAEIHVAVIAEWASLLERQPAVDRIWSYERHKDRTARAKSIARIAWRLRKERFDCVVNFHASPSSAHLSFATGAKTRSIHFHGHKDKNRFSTVDIPGKNTVKPVIERDMDTIRALGISIPEGRMPQIYLASRELEKARERIMALGLSSPILVLGLGASRPTKSWPVERFASLAVNWQKQTQGSAIAVVGSNENALAHEFLKQLDDALSVLDSKRRAAARSKILCEIGLPLRELAAIMSRSSVFVGNDSGPKHIAVSVSVPTTTLFGPEDPFEWHPYPKHLHPYFFVEGLPCRRDGLPQMPPWCGIQACVEEQHRCMKQIGVEEVQAKCLQIMRKSL